MRPIRFRIFDKITKKIETVSILNIESNIAKYEVVETGHTISRTIGVECELMQSTGCTDKNGKEIYEGDIITWHEYGEVHEVLYKFGAFCISLHPDSCDGDILGESAFPDCEIIGNIYENPELLK